jgi:hypothetical protein
VPVTVLRGQLLDEASPAEAAAHAQVALRGLDGLLVPVDINVVDGEHGVSQLEAVARLRGQLPYQGQPG